MAAHNHLPAVVSLLFTFGYKGMLSDDSAACLEQMQAIVRVWDYVFAGLSIAIGLKERKKDLQGLTV